MGEKLSKRGGEQPDLLQHQKVAIESDLVRRIGKLFKTGTQPYLDLSIAVSKCETKQDFAKIIMRVEKAEAKYNIKQDD